MSSMNAGGPNKSGWKKKEECNRPIGPYEWYCRKGEENRKNVSQDHSAARCHNISGELVHTRTQTRVTVRLGGRKIACNDSDNVVGGGVWSDVGLTLDVRILCVGYHPLNSDINWNILKLLSARRRDPAEDSIRIFVR